MLKEISSFSSEQFLVNWPSFLEDMIGETGIVMGDFYSVFTSTPLHNLLPEGSKLFKKCFIQYFSSGDVYSHPAEPSGKQKRLTLLKTLLLTCTQQYFGKHYG